MVTLKITQQQHCEEQAQQTLSTADRVHKLTARNEQLDHHSWTDQQIQSIPDELVEFAFENSASLRQEFKSLNTFLAYRCSLHRAKR